MTNAVDKKQDTDPAPDWGPAMAALSEKRRALVIALFDEDAPKEGKGIYAAQVAGYGTPTSSKKSLGVIAGRIIHSAPVQAAIAEYSRQVNRAITPEAIMALKNVIRDPKHKDHARAIAMVIDRSDPPQTVTTLRVEDVRPPSPEITKQVLDRIEELMRRFCVPPPKVIEADCRDVTPREATA
jgi:hypothetical protein